jgi:uncharacterized protein GlcG (DUF336 family)
MNVSIAVVDDASVLLHFFRMDGAMHRERPVQSRESYIGRGSVPIRYHDSMPAYPARRN